MRIREIFLLRHRIRAGWRILLFLLVSFPPLYYITSLLWTQLLIRYVIIFWLLLTLSFVFARYIDRRPIGTVGFMLHSRWIRDYLLGAALGFAPVSIIFTIALSLGYIEAELSNLTVTIILNILVLCSIKTMFQSAFEELFFRGYIFQNLIEGTNPFTATVLTSAIFGAGHLLVPNSSWMAALNLTILGVLLAIGYLKTRSLWLSSAVHFGWNFSMGHIYGFSVSGGQRSDTLLNIEQKGPSWITGGDFGPEAGIPASILMIAASLLIYYWREIKPAPETSRLWAIYEKK